MSHSGRQYIWIRRQMPYTPYKIGVYIRYRSRDLNSFFAPALDTGPLWEYSNSNNLLPQCGKIRGKRDFAR